VGLILSFAIFCLTGEHVRAIRYAAQVRNASKIYICRENPGIYTGMDLLRYEYGMEGKRNVYRIVVGTHVPCLDISSVDFSSKC
jgi:hypothetical protein